MPATILRLRDSSKGCFELREDLRMVYSGEEAAPRAGFFSPGAGAGNKHFWYEKGLVFEFLFSMT